MSPFLLEQLYRDQRARALGRLRRLLGNPAWAEDVWQDCFARLLEPHAAFDGRSDVRRWLDAVLTHRAMSDLRRRPVRPDPPDATVPPADDAFDVAEAIARMRVALERLSERDRVLIGLHHFQELGHPEIAARLRLPEGTVKSRLSRARARLAELMLEAA